MEYNRKVNWRGLEIRNRERGKEGWREREKEKEKGKDKKSIKKRKGDRGEGRREEGRRGEGMEAGLSSPSILVFLIETYNIQTCERAI